MPSFAAIAFIAPSGAELYITVPGACGSIVLRRRTGSIVELGGQHTRGVQNFCTEICQLGSFFEVELTHRARTLYIPGVIVVHAVDISPYLNLVGLEDRTDNRSGVVAAATLEVVDTSMVVAAYITLCDKI